MALFVAALCHDIDHRGYSNSYQILTKSTLAGLYGHKGSIMENHHIHQTMRVLHLEDCNIFNQLPKLEYYRAKDLICQTILATDLSRHLCIISELKHMAENGYQVNNPDHHQNLLSLIVTASDLNDQCKPWPNTREAASLIYDEFFNQGDQEKLWSVDPIPSMDRSKAFIPELQIYFLDSIVLPCYTTLSIILPSLKSIINTIRKNCFIWQKLSDEFKSGRLTNYSNYDLFLGKYDNLAENYSSLFNCDEYTFHSQTFPLN